MNLASDDPLFRQLSRLAPVVPDDVHSNSVRARCHAALGRQRRRRGPAAEVRVTRRCWELAVAGGFAAVYLSAVIQQALAMYGLN